jgi:integrase
MEETVGLNAMGYVTRISVLSSGERFPILLYERTLQPVILPTRYVIDRRRETKQSSTIERDVRVLGWLYVWADKQGINMEQLLRKGELLNPSQVTGFCRYLRAMRQENLIGAIHPNTNARIDVLLPITFNAYISVVEDFLTWAVEEFLPRPKGISESVRTTVVEVKDRIDKMFGNNRIGGTTAQRLGLTDEEVAEIRLVVKPGSPRNPFKKPVQFRNYLIVELLLLTGIRRGELLKLRLMALPVGPKTTLTVKRSPDDKDDPRRVEPEVKTLEREIPIPRWLAIALWGYVGKHRTKGAHSYVFTSKRGKLPLNYGGVNWIFLLLVKRCFPSLKGRLHPHSLRHTFNNRLAQRAKELGWNEDRLKKSQRYLNGWVEQSTMPERYTQRVIQGMAMELAESYQNSLYSQEVF